MKNFIVNIAIEAALIGAFYAWHFRGLNSAGTFFAFVMWTFTGFLALGVFGAKPKRRPGLFKTIHGCLFSISVTAMLLWGGLTALSICYFTLWILSAAKLSSVETA